MDGPRIPGNRDASAGTSGSGGGGGSGRRSGRSRSILLVILVKVFTSDTFAMTRARDLGFVTLAVVL